MRIASVRYPNSDKTQDYLCIDKTIKEGDVVILEGMDKPHYIAEIKNILDTTLPLKKVLSKAVLNNKVTLSSKYMDITTIDTDCIVNSLGTDIQEFGMICKSIYYKSNSKELKEYIKNHKKGNIFDIKVTDAGVLPSKHIINIVMPYKYSDDNNKALKKAFSLVIDTAIELKYKSIAIPYIGTGANGYSYEDIHEALNDVMFIYQYKPNISIDIVSVRYHSRSDEIYHEYANVSNYHINNNKPFNGREEFVLERLDDYKNIGLIQDAIRRHYRVEDEIYINSLYSPDDFISKVFKNTDDYTRNILRNIIPDNARKNIARFKKQVSKKEIFSSAFTLKLNFTQIVQYMEIAGYTFSPVSKYNLDMEIFKYIVENDGFTKPLWEMEEYFEKYPEILKILIEFEAPKRKRKNKDD